MINMDAKRREIFNEKFNSINKKLRPELNSVLDLISRGQKPKNFKRCRHYTEVKKFLKCVYQEKCVFCEKKPEKLDIDHYRPKGGAREFDGEKTYLVADEKNELHPGYYWLAYEVTNLLLLCSDCNGGDECKHTKFPVSGTRLFKHPEDESQWRVDSGRLLDEKPLLLHPLVDEPESHIKIDSSGKAVPVNGSKKGAMTINVCNLNRHDLWIDRRKKIIDDIFRELKNQLSDFSKYLEKNETIDIKKIKWIFLIFNRQFSRLKINKAKNYEFSRVYHCMYEKFDEFLDENNVTMELSATDKSLIKKIFLWFKNERP